MVSKQASDGILDAMAADRKPRMEIVVALMLGTWLLAMWTE